MTKRDIVVKIAKETGVIQKDVGEIVQLTLDYLAEDIIAGNTVELRNFGVFEIAVRRSKIGHNPNKPNDEIIIPEHCSVKFKAGKTLREEVEKLDPAQFSKL